MEEGALAQFIHYYLENLLNYRSIQAEYISGDAEEKETARE
jgi:hypothetical protein